MARPVMFSRYREAKIRPVQRLSSFLKIKPLTDFPRGPVKMPWEWITPIRVVLPTRDEWREIHEKTMKKTALGWRGYFTGSPVTEKPFLRF